LIALSACGTKWEFNCFSVVYAVMVRRVGLISPKAEWLKRRRTDTHNFIKREFPTGPGSVPPFIYHRSVMPFTLLQSTVLALGLYTIWSILQRVFGSSVLDNLPGPPSRSILTGVRPILHLPHFMTCIVTGNLSEFTDPDGWEFHADIEQNYGQVVKIRGLLGVH
jgi:hypothetical protein